MAKKNLSVWDLGNLDQYTIDQLQEKISKKSKQIESIEKSLQYADHGAYGQDCSHIRPIQEDIRVIKMEISQRENHYVDFELTPNYDKNSKISGYIMLSRDKSGKLHKIFTFKTNPSKNQISGAIRWVLENRKDLNLV